LLLDVAHLGVVVTGEMEIEKPTLVKRKEEIKTKTIIFV